MTIFTKYLTLPLFPLGTTLYPGGLLPLQIFEVRYLEMIKNCVKQKTPFGVVVLDQGNEVRQPNESIRFASIGTFANIDHFEVIQPNLYMVRCIGGVRFTVRNFEKEKNGLWVAEVEAMPADPIIPIPPELQKTANTLKRIFEAMKQQGVTDDQIPSHAAASFNDCGWVANRWSELLPINPGQKEHLLGLVNPRLRLDLILDILEELGISESDSF